MNKKTVFYNLWWLMAFPALAVCLLAAVASFLTLNYEYLPAETDFLAVLFYELSYIVLDMSLCVNIGAFCYALYKRKALPALITAAVTLLNAGIVPMAVFFVRSIFLASTSSAGIMEQYFSVDVYVSVANLLKMAAFVLIALVVMAVYFFGKIEKPIAKPRFAPKSEPTVSALTMTVVYLIYSTLVFTFSGEYDFISLGMQIIFSVISYFVTVVGIYAAQKKCGIE